MTYSGAVLSKEAPGDDRKLLANTSCHASSTICKCMITTLVTSLHDSHHSIGSFKIFVSNSEQEKGHRSTRSAANHCVLMITLGNQSCENRKHSTKKIKHQQKQTNKVRVSKSTASAASPVRSIFAVTSLRR